MPYLEKIYPNKSLKECINIGNKVINTLLTAQPTLDELNNMTYATAKFITSKASPDLQNRNKKNKNKNRESPWKSKQLKNLKEALARLSRIKEYQSGSRSTRLCNRIERIKQYFRSKKIYQLDEMRVEVENDIKALSNRIKNKNKTAEQPIQR